ncbi:hypothetical protein AB2N04_09080 [Nitratireductor sp. GISD-1A_MAKvit]|uniref:hypothetical protein n=1 Tax=Nitratireductor sp. GISD-1A_MAKvit TaxID=3234198 RepID=UPI003467A94B
MNSPADPNFKTRLTDPKAMVAQVKALLVKGIQPDEIAPELSKIYYVDVDLLNAVLRVVRKMAASAKGPEEPKADGQSDGQNRAAA